MHVDNQEYYGHLVNPESFTTSHLHNDLYEIFENKYVSSSPMNELIINSLTALLTTFDLTD